MEVSVHPPACVNVQASPEEVRARLARVAEVEGELRDASEAYGLLMEAGAPPHRVTAAERRMDRASNELRALGVIRRTHQRVSR